MELRRLKIWRDLWQKEADKNKEVYHSTSSASVKYIAEEYYDYANFWIKKFNRKIHLLEAQQ